MGKPKIALYWCSSCGGCEESVLDLGPGLVERAERLEIVFWPVALDFKRADLERLDDGELAVALVNGAARTVADLDMLRLLRRKSRWLVAHGACAQFGGVVGLGNVVSRRELLGDDWGDAGCAAAPLLPRAGPLKEHVVVDAAIPGCPPTPELVAECLDVVISAGDLPRDGVFGPARALCRTCPRSSTLPDAPVVNRFRRPQEVLWDPQRCFLAQELVCLGPATRDGCGARCIAGNAPCRGCFGPVVEGSDQGAQAASFLATLVDPAVEPGAAELADPVGLLYRYTLADSLLPGCGRPPVANGPAYLGRTGNAFVEDDDGA